MRARGMASPDEWDAVALTFAEPVGEGNKYSNMRMEDIMRLYGPRVGVA